MDLDTYNVIQKMGQLDPMSSPLTILELFPLLLRDLMVVVQQILNLKNLQPFHNNVLFLNIYCSKFKAFLKPFYYLSLSLSLSLSHRLVGLLWWRSVDLGHRGCGGDRWLCGYSWWLG